MRKLWLSLIMIPFAVTGCDWGTYEEGVGEQEGVGLGAQEEGLGQEGVGLGEPGMQAGQQAQQPGGIQVAGQQQLRGTYEGTVQQLDYGAGTLMLETAQGRQQLHARPVELDRLNQGEVVTVEFAQYDGETWVVPTQGQDLQAWQNTQGYARQATYTGTVQEIDRGQGTVTIDGQTFRTHPEAIDNVTPGQFVNLQFVTVSGENWMTAISPAAQQQGV